MKEFFLKDSVVEKNICIAPEIFSMEIFAPEVANTAKPGQFIMLYLDRGELLLPRPISICAATDDVLRIVYQVVGKGTKVLSEMKAGEKIKILGAIGNGFKIEGTVGQARRDGYSRVALIGGGIGVPPLLMLAKEFAKRGIKVDAFLGFRSAPILSEEFQTVSDRVFVTTEDGSFGHKGFITEVLKSQNETYDEFLACGPLPLLRALKTIAAKKNIPCQICMEQRMACGLGTCVGCVVKAGGEYVRVCSEGPVFYASEVDLDD